MSGCHGDLFFPSWRADFHRPESGERSRCRQVTSCGNIHNRSFIPYCGVWSTLNVSYSGLKELGFLKLREEENE